MQQVQFEMGFMIEGKESVCGFRSMEDDKGQYILLCASQGDYSREYELRMEGEGEDCSFHFVTPDVPEDLKRHECEISDAILEQMK
ncbi:hypothetical protein [Polluticoccus soli]|uniref:hypothetical protein n=1 Tax=Polluticoccus soli TaxID=3034150 RepID=UPI0023E273FF|nr:hypothetical protein [Flavipsychrobacter sp. JY13-12]